TGRGAVDGLGRLPTVTLPGEVPEDPDDSRAATPVTQCDPEVASAVQIGRTVDAGGAARPVDPEPATDGTGTSRSDDRQRIDDGPIDPGQASHERAIDQGQPSDERSVDREQAGDDRAIDREQPSDERSVDGSDFVWGPHDEE
ncbi:MAG: hypothetical protein ACOC0Z_06080, partial [Halohasta sp.]